MHPDYLPQKSPTATLGPLPQLKVSNLKDLSYYIHLGYLYGFLCLKKKKYVQTFIASVLNRKYQSTSFHHL